MVVSGQSGFDIRGGDTTPPHHLRPRLIIASRMSVLYDSRRLTSGRSVRTRLFSLPGRVVNHSRRLILRLPTDWPWARTYRTALNNTRALPQLS